MHAAEPARCARRAAALAVIGAQAALVAQSPYYQLLLGRVLGYREDNIRHHIQVCGTLSLWTGLCALQPWFAGHCRGTKLPAFLPRTCSLRTVHPQHPRCMSCSCHTCLGCPSLNLSPMQACGGVLTPEVDQAVAAELQRIDAGEVPGTASGEPKAALASVGVSDRRASTQDDTQADGEGLLRAPGRVRRAAKKKDKAGQGKSKGFG